MLDPHDTPPAIPEAPEPIKASAGQDLSGLAQAARLSIMRSLQRVNLRQGIPATDSTGHGYIVLATPSVPVSQINESAEASPPFSISIFADEFGQTRWLPARASVLGYNGDQWFYPFEPTLGGTALSLITAAAAPAVPPAGLDAYLRIQWEIDDVQLVEGQPVYAVRVSAVTVETVPHGDPPPTDDIDSGVTHRPWFTVGPEVDGQRQLTYQTLGYCHFWLMLRVLGESDPSSSSSSSSQSSSRSSPPPPDSSSGSSSPPSHQACFGIRQDGRMRHVTWGMILRPLATLRHTFRVRITKGRRRWTIKLPDEWVGSVEKGTAQIVATWQSRPTGLTLIAELTDSNEIVVTAPSEAPARSGELVVHVEGLIEGASHEVQFTNAAGRRHNLNFWNSIP